MRILAVTPYYVPDGGGLERYAHETLRHLAVLGHEVEVVAASTGGSESFLQDGVRVHCDPPMFRIGNSPVTPDLSRRLRRRIRRVRPDVVLAHTPVPFPAEAAAHAASKEAVPFVLTYHAGRLRGSSFVLDAMASAARRLTQPRLLRRSDRLIAVSNFVRDVALRGHEDRTTVIPPGVDTEKFRPGNADPRTILFAGPLDNGYRWKGVDILRDAFDILREDGVDARLHLVGGGDRLKEFSAWAAGRSDVKVQGRLPEQAFVTAMQNAGVVVLPSRTDAEAFGMVLAEANACGRPVVGARIGGIPDFVQPGVNGELVAPGDVDGLATTLKDLLASPGRMDAMGARGRHLVETQHTWPEVARRTDAALRRAVA